MIAPNPLEPSNLIRSPVPARFTRQNVRVAHNIILFNGYRCVSDPNTAHRWRMLTFFRGGFFFPFDLIYFFFFVLFFNYTRDVKNILYRNGRRDVVNGVVRWVVMMVAAMSVVPWTGFLTLNDEWTRLKILSSTQPLAAQLLIRSFIRCYCCGSATGQSMHVCNNICTHLNIWSWGLHSMLL